MHRVRSAVVVAAAFVAFTVAAPLAHGAGEDNGTDVVTAFVGPGSQTDPEGNYFVIPAEPGATVTQTLVLRNDRPHAIEAHVDAVDAFTSDGTGANYEAPGSTPDGTGAWIVVATPVVTLQPEEQRAVEFTLRVPLDAEPGVHLAGLSASVPLPEELATATTTPPSTAGGGTTRPVESTTSTTSNKAGVGVTLQGRRVIAVQVNVPGPAAPNLAVTGVRPTATPEGLVLLVAMENTGNDYARGTGTITAPATDLAYDFTIDTFVPRTRIEFPVAWTPDVIPGTHEIGVELRYGDNQRVNWNGTLDIDDGLRDRLESDLAKVRIAGPGGIALLPVLVAGSTVALGCAAGALAMRRRAGRSGRRTRIAPAS